MKKLADCSDSLPTQKFISALSHAGIKICFVLGIVFGALQIAQAQIVVNSLGDESDTSINGICASSSGCTLRAAIQEANSTVAADTINFSVAGSITPATSLPPITQPLTINGYTAPGASQNTGVVGVAFNGVLTVELNGSSAGSSGTGLRISASNCTIQGLAVNRFQDSGIRIDTGSTNNIFGNFIGTNLAGTAASGNFNRGILINGSTGNNIGTSTDVASRNVISGNFGTGISITNGGSATIRRNLIGTDKNGTADLGNTQEGVRIVDSSNSFVGTASGSRNVISGNDGSGVSIIQTSTTTTATANTIAGNYIGVDITGNATMLTGSGFQTSTVGNDGSGVLINASGNTVGGGTGATTGNVISGNSANGVSISSNFATGNIVTKNTIGFGADDTTTIGNRDNGVQVSNLAANNTIGNVGAGLANIIANNGDATATSARAGVYLDETAGTGNAIRGNSIFMNTGIGIDLGAPGATANDAMDPDTGANNLQNSPVLNSANTAGVIGGTLNSTPNTTFAIDFFRNVSPDSAATSEARTFIGSVSVTTDATGNATVSFNSGATALAVGQFVTATATSTGGAGAQAVGDTSEISNAQAVAATTGGVGGFESDVASRPNGNGAVQSNDVVQVRRFLNNADTPDTTTNEFQRADAAPFASRGDGEIASNDVVQARRYVNNSDPQQTAGGPLVRNGGRVAEISEATETDSLRGTTRQLRVESVTSSAGQTVTVNVRVDAVGDEAEYAFILNYQAPLTNPVVGNGNAGALLRDCNIATAGQVNCSIGGFPNNNPASSNSGIGEIANANNQILITVTFTIASNATAGTTPLTLTNVNASNDAAQLVPITSMNGTVTITPAGGTRQLRVENATGSAGQTVTVNVRVDAVGDEAEYAFILNYQAPLTNPVVGNGNAGALLRDCNIATAGQVNCSIGGFPNNNPASSNSGIGEIANANNQILITVTFTIASNATAGTTPLTLTNVNASNDAAQLVPITSMNGTVTIAGPTASGASVGGRLKTANGIGISGASVALFDTQSGETISVTTDQNGAYVFEGIPVGGNYVITPQTLGFNFNPSSRFFSLVEELTTVDFIGVRKGKFKKF